MDIKVELILRDTQELMGLTNYIQQVEQYRAANQAPPPQAPAAEPPPPPDASVVAHISPEGAVKAPKDAEMTQAAQAYANKHGIDGALAVLREFGVARVSEVQDPAKKAELYQRFVDGAK